jgi:hypothetical protein
MIELSEHAFPFLIGIVGNTLLCRRVDLFIGDLHEVLELQLVLVALGDEIGGVEEDARVGEGDDPSGG